MRRALAMLLLTCSLAGAQGWDAYRAAAVRLRFSETGPFAPTDIANLYYWFDLSDTATMTFAGTNVIAQVRSKGSVTNAMFAGGFYPLLTNDAPSGLSCANFPTTAQRGWSLPFVINMPATNGAAYTFIAAYDRATNGLLSVLWSAVAPVRGQPGIHATDNKLYAQIHGAYRASSNTFSFGRSVLTVSGTGAADGYTMRIDGAAVAMTAPIALSEATNVAAVGFYQASNNTYHQGKMFELLYYNRQLSSAEIAQVEGYLKSKWSTQ